MRKPIVIGNFTINLNGHPVSYILKRSFSARLIWLTIKPRTGLCVTTPCRYSLKNLPGFLQSKSDWILQHLAAEIPLTAGPRPGAPRNLRTVTYLGQKLKITREVKNCDPAFPITLAQDQLLVNLPVSRGSAAKPQIAAWLRDQAGRIIHAKVETLCRETGLTFRRITIRNQKTRWGSCSRLKNLSFNWRIIMAPEPVLDYVVVHEVCHLKELSHSKSFWALVARHCPEWRERRRWLNAHTGELNLQFQD